MLLETYTPLEPEMVNLPEFLNIVKNVTGQPRYSMYNLSKVDNVDTLQTLLDVDED